MADEVKPEDRLTDWEPGQLVVTPPPEDDEET